LIDNFLKSQAEDTSKAETVDCTIIKMAVYSDFDDYCIYKKNQQKSSSFVRIPTLRQWKNVLQRDHILIARDSKTQKIY